MFTEVDTYYISDEFAAQYVDKQPPWGFNGLGYVTYKRTYARRVFVENSNAVDRTEEWYETVQRVVNGAQDIGAQLTQSEAERLYDYIFNLKGCVAGRMLWQLGTPNNHRLGGDSLVNCWYVDIQKPSDFSWSVERLMLGGGVGFSCDKPERLGIVRQAAITHVDADDSDFIVPDTREGWGNVIRKVFECYLGDDDLPRDMSYATHLIRKAGLPIKTFGGTASGPEILIEGIAKLCKVMDNAVGRHLSSVDVLDCMNILGSIVVAGNVRRSAEIALGSIDDDEYLMAKRWDLGNIPIERAMSNNTVFVTPEQMKNLPEMVWEGYKGNGEPYGFFNLEASRKYGRMGEERIDDTIVGTNPCGEIPLANRESCNLSEVFLPMITSRDELVDVVQLLYKVQKAVAALPYLDPTSDKITSANMRLGLGVTGVTQALDKIDWLDEAYVKLRELDKEWSAYRGWPESVRLTTIKPSGTLSILPGVTPGVHPGFSRFFVKRMRMAASDFLVEYCRSKGYHVEPLRNFDGSLDSRTVVVHFPCEFPDGTIFADKMSAIEQMDLVRKLQKVWADNSISVTVYYHLDELDGIREYLSKYWNEMKSVSFLLHSDHGFDQAPLGELSEEEYLIMFNSAEPLGEHISGSTIVDDDFLDGCDTGHCPIR